MASEAQLVKVRGEMFFVCEYTGALVRHYYSIRSGKNLEIEEGCFATLPILLRAVLDEEGGDYSERFQKIKHDCEVFYVQPDIPVQPPLKEFPLSQNELAEYAEKMELGMSWLLVDKASTYEPKKKRPRNKKN